MIVLYGLTRISYELILKMDDCDEWHEFRFCHINGSYMLGDNSSDLKNGLVDISICPNIVIIPHSVNGTDIKEIGKNAMYDCKNIIELYIFARITQINHAAFRLCSNIIKVYLPNTLEFIFNDAINVYDSKNGLNIVNPGTTEVFFEQNSKLRFLGSHSISYRYTMKLYFCNHVKVTIENDPFAKVNEIKIYSPINFVLKNIKSSKTNISSQCIVQYRNTCIINKRFQKQLFFFLSLAAESK